RRYGASRPLHRPGFFFSSRRRHTRWPRDWSSDVCSSDLPRRRRQAGAAAEKRCVAVSRRRHREFFRTERHAPDCVLGGDVRAGRSEERRVGKECGCGWLPEQEKKKGSAKSIDGEANADLV